MQLLTGLKHNKESASMKGVNEMFNALLSNGHYRLCLFFSNEPLLAFISCAQRALQPSAFISNSLGALMHQDALSKLQHITHKN